MRKLTTVAALSFQALLPTASALAQAPTLIDALKDGRFTLGLRYRYEAVDQYGFDDKGQASSLRTTLEYASRPWHGLGVVLEFEDVHSIGLEDAHNDKGFGFRWNNVSDKPVIADPEGTEINQAFLRVKSHDWFTFSGGRQEVVLGNQRFVGNVGWRQNHQSFDAVRFDLTPVAGTTLTYVYLDRVQRVFGDTKPLSSHLIEAEQHLANAAIVRGYGYRIVYDNVLDRGLSTFTYGASIVGKTQFADTAHLTYRVELARQQDTGNNPEDVSAGYRRGELGFMLTKLSVIVGSERLEGNPRNGTFSTPLATLHAFNGWADVFLSTPTHGLDDVFVSLGYRLASTTLDVVWHDFSAESTPLDYGTELDVQIVVTAPNNVKIGLKAARYDASKYAVDTDKLMMWAAWSL